MHNQVKNVSIGAGGHLHFVGIGGVGMSALAHIAKAQGYHVSGSDSYASTRTCRLQSEGISVTIGHTQSLSEVDCLVYSSAIDENNPEILFARHENIPIVHRSQLLQSFMQHKLNVGITGTHGKTTTSAMIAVIFEEWGLKPTAIVGGIMRNYGSNALVGDNELFVAEVDESDKSLLNIKPTIAIITNLEAEHLDTYKDIRDLRETFKTFVNGISKEGKVIYNADDQNVVRVIARTKGTQMISFGLKREAFYQARNIVTDREHGQTFFTLYLKGTCYNTIAIPCLGKHNVYNALAAIATANELGIQPEDATQMLMRFKGTGRRMDILFKDDDRMIIDDYAHHPTEIAATIEALNQLRGNGQKVHVYFQPHRYSRSFHLRSQFGKCFDGVDKVVVTDIYSAGESWHEKIDSSVIIDEIKMQSSVPVSFKSRSLLLDDLETSENEAAIVAFLGAGNITEVAHEYAARIKARYINQ